MKILKTIGIVVASIVILLALIIMFLPSRAHVQRSIVINASAEKIFPAIDGFTYFKEWSPWVKKDSLTTYEFTGGMSGVGATMHWKSSVVGNGSQKTIELETNKRIKSELVFDGMDASTAEFTLVPEGNATKVTWTLDSDLSGLGKAFGPFMDVMVGPDYESGLQSLKTYSEKL